MSKEIQSWTFAVFVTMLFFAGSTFGAQTGPQTLSFQGYLTDSSGAPISGAKEMRFGLYIGGGRAWYAEYSAVQVNNGSYSVSLGASEQGASALDPTTGDPIALSALPMTAGLVAGVSAAQAVEIELEIFNGSQFETLSPRIPVTATLFALSADTLDGLDSENFVQFNGAGAVVAHGGTPVIDTAGNWIGPNSGLVGPAGPTGPAGAVVYQMRTANQNSTRIVVDCQAGHYAISGGGDCISGSNNRVLASCPAAAANSTTCTTTIPSRYWMVACSRADSSNKAYALCVVQ